MNRECLLNIFNSALFAADPYNAVKKTIKITEQSEVPQILRFTQNDKLSIHVMLDEVKHLSI